jgi:hypothetical protein
MNNKTMDYHSKMKKLFYLLLFIPVFYSCTTSDKCARIEKRIAKLYQKCPDLVKSDTTETTDSTIVYNSDTIFVEKKVIDSLLKVLTDTITITQKEVIIKRIKSECKTKVITNTIDKVVYKNRTINKPYPIITKPTFLEILVFTWWWLLIAFGLGMIVNGFKK